MCHFVDLIVHTVNLYMINGVNYKIHNMKIFTIIICCILGYIIIYLSYSVYERPLIGQIVNLNYYLISVPIAAMFLKRNFSSNHQPIQNNQEVVKE